MMLGNARNAPLSCHNNKSYPPTVARTIFCMFSNTYRNVLYQLPLINKARESTLPTNITVCDITNCSGQIVSGSNSGFRHILVDQMGGITIGYGVLLKQA